MDYSARLIRAMASSVALLAMLAAAPSFAQDVVDGFVPRTFSGAKGATLPYRLFIPEAANRERALPVVIYLHGSGGAGTDNLAQISGGNASSTHLWTRYRAFVVAPQIPVGEAWRAPGAEVSANAALILELLASLSREFSIDADRVYLVGQSLGGYGTWDLIAKRPDVFAAAVPLCGGGDPARIPAARGVPIWAFHGARDQAVPVTFSRDTVAALRAVGSSVKYTEYADTGHDVWTRAFAEPELPIWLFSQRRAHH